jgi:hypothetical protein
MNTLNRNLALVSLATVTLMSVSCDMNVVSGDKAARTDASTEDRVTTANAAKSTTIFDPSETPESTNTPLERAGLLFPRDPEPSKDFMSAMGSGRLFVSERCIRMGSPEGVSDVVVWPYGYSLSESGGEIRILNEDGEVEAQVGDVVRMGGGLIIEDEFARAPVELKQAFREKRKELGVPNQCRGSIWGAAPGIHVVRPK